MIVQAYREMGGETTMPGLPQDLGFQRKTPSFTKAGLGKRINMIMQSVFFKLSGVSWKKGKGRVSFLSGFGRLRFLGSFFNHAPKIFAHHQKRVKHKPQVPCTG